MFMEVKVSTSEDGSEADILSFVHSREIYAALCDVDEVARSALKHGTDPVSALEHIRELTSVRWKVDD